MTNAVDLPAVEGTELVPLLREELAMHLCHVFPQLPIRQIFSVLVLTEETHVGQRTGQVVTREAGRQSNDFGGGAGQQVGHRVLRAEVALHFF